MIWFLNLEADPSFWNILERKIFKKFMEYLNGVNWIVNSIHTHGYAVAKFYFLNPVECTWFSHFTSTVNNEELNKANQDWGSEEDTYKIERLTKIEKAVHFCNEEQIKINDLQNFVFQNTKYLLLTYPEYGRDIEEIELALIEIHKKSTDMLESK